MTKTGTLTPQLACFEHFHLCLRICLLIGAWSLVLPIWAGCSSGPPSGKVRGKVTFKGKPVAEGLVTFINPKEGGAAEAYLNKDGTYAVQNPVVLGEYQVVITPLVEIVDTDPGKTPPSPVEKAAPDIPRKYRTPGATPLKATVKQGENEFPFDLTP
jgi:hypothetical protein